MRKKLIFAAAAASAALLALASCTKEASVGSIEKESQETAESEAPVFTATIAGSTKVNLSIEENVGKLSWEDGDIIKITDAANTTVDYKVSSIDPETGRATFVERYRTIEPHLGEGPYTATYGTEPAKEQTYSATAGNLYMAAPETSGTDFTFKVQCGLMKLNLTQAGEDIRKITVSGTTAEGEACTYTLNCEAAESIESAKDFFIALPAGEYTKFVFSDSKGNVCIKKAKGDPLGMNVNHILPVTIPSMKFIYSLAIFDAAPEDGYKAMQW